MSKFDAIDASHGLIPLSNANSQIMITLSYLGMDSSQVKEEEGDVRTCGCSESPPQNKKSSRGTWTT